MMNAWGCDSLSIQQLATNSLQVFLVSEELVDYVLQSGPWNFKNQLVFLRPWTETFDWNSPSLDMEFFWLHIVGLPRFCYTMDVGIKLARTLPQCLNLQLRTDRRTGFRFF